MAFKSLFCLFFLGLAFSFQLHAENPVVVIDAGHGGPDNPEVLDASRWNGASYKTKDTLFLEKDLALEMALRVIFQINKSGKVTAVPTRTTDVNMGMKDRAKVGTDHKAVGFVSIHFNSAPSAKGPVAVIQSVKHGNTGKQHGIDQEVGSKLARAVETVTKQIDPGSRARATQDYDIKPEGSHLLMNLRNNLRGKEMFACFLEIEFLDNPSVAKWLVEDSHAKETRMKIADTIAEAIVTQFTRTP